MGRVFTKENFARLAPGEGARLMYIWMNQSSGSGYGAGGYLPDDCSECGACGSPMLGSGGLCGYCSKELDTLIRKASGE